LRLDPELLDPEGRTASQPEADRGLAGNDLKAAEELSGSP
jgi:hypothetical protein